MDTTPLSVRLLALLGSLAAILAVFFLVVRPWYLQWGATDEEARRPLPGDEIIASAAGQETRAITIDAPAERVWPWLAQIGQDRGGFYSFDLLENAVGCNMPTIDRLRPERQAWQLGDRLWMYPSDRAGGIGFATLRAFEPGRALGFGTRAVGRPSGAEEDGSWSFVVSPVSAAETRLLVRGRSGNGRSFWGRVLDRAFFEPAHFAMERRMLLGLKQLAEGASRARLANHVQVILWTITFGVFVVSMALVVLRQTHWIRPLIGFVAAAVLFAFLTLAQPSPLLGIALLATLMAFVTWPERPVRLAEL